MALWHCRACGAAYAVGLSCCPQCRSTYYEEDVVVPKISKASGVTFEKQPAPAAGAAPAAEPVDEETPDTPPAKAETPKTTTATPRPPRSPKS